jgi:hypothetical protein
MASLKDLDKASTGSGADRVVSDSRFLADDFRVDLMTIN